MSFKIIPNLDIKSPPEKLGGSSCLLPTSFVKVKQERERGDRRLEREEAEAQRNAEQPELFKF